MHVLFIHQAFALPSEPGGTRHYELMKRCAKEGHEFSIVRSNLNYKTGRKTKAQELGEEKEFENLRIIKAFTPSFIHQSFFWRLVAYLVFMFSSLSNTFRVRSVDVVMGTSPPIFQAITAWISSILHRSPFLLEIRDLWPDFPVELGVLQNPIIIGLGRFLERFLYRRADHIIVNSPAYKDSITKKGIAADKISVVPNGVDVNMFDPNDKGEEIQQSLKLADKFIVTYAGALGEANDIPTIIRAAEHLKDHSEIHFLLVGDGKKRGDIESLVKKFELENVTLYGSVPKNEIPKLLAASDALVATLKNVKSFRKVYPNKIFDYMAAGRPIVSSIDGVIREVVEDSDGGIFVPPGKSAQLAEVIKELYNDPERRFEMGRSAREHVEENFHRDIQADQLTKVIENFGENQK